MSTVPIIIPSLEPDDRFLQLLQLLQKESLSPVVVVDDGSGDAYAGYFVAAQQEYGAVVLRHEVNQGKGRALKTAFEYCLRSWPELVGCVTADSDGQHLPADIRRCIEAVCQQPNALVLGVRDFSGPDVPAKSRFGNRLTCCVLRFAGGVAVRDTQTGLRGIPSGFMRHLLTVPGDRFEFETAMLLQTKEQHIPICEVPIQTVYDSKTNHSTHFHPVRDSLRIYSVIGARFAKFLFSSLSASAIDLVLFTLLCHWWRGWQGVAYVSLATAAARVISAAYNYLVNYFFVFRSQQRHSRSGPRYLLLAVLQLAASAALTTLLVYLLPAVPETLIKAPVDVLLFFISYQIQRRLVY